MHLNNIKARKWFGLLHGFKVVIDVHYPGGYIKDGKSKRDWMKDRTEMWDRKKYTISVTTRNYPQKNNAAVVRTIKYEWIFLQRITTHTGDAFAGVEKMIWDFFALYFIWKEKIFLTPKRSSKYNVGQEIQIRPPESSDVSD